MKIFAPQNRVPVAAFRQSAGPAIKTEKSAAVCRHAATSRSAFTMVEIALCLAIVGFALVAIIGVLPAGLNVQKENREDTILNQDSTVWLDAIRSGSFGYDELTNYVDRIVVSSQNFDANSQPVGGLIQTVGEASPHNNGRNNGSSDPTLSVVFNGGASVVGLLSTPRFGPPTIGAPATAVFSTNNVYAYVRAMSGSATEKPPQGNADVRDGAFSYRMVVEVLPVGWVDYAGILTNATDAVMRGNLADVRLLCRWPLKEPFSSTLALDRPAVGNSRIVFRAQASGQLPAVPNGIYPAVRFYFFQPQQYQ